jgi:putative phosphoribosyl transferase
MEVRFENRAEAGRFLATKLKEYKDRPDVVVMALPRGGVPVAYEVARELHTPLDILIVRKLGAPGHEELAVGAIASGGISVVNREIINSLHISEDALQRIAAREQKELERREHEYRGNLPIRDISGKTMILIDDGLATGATMWAAVSALRQRKPAAILVAVPTAARQVCEAFREIADDVICGITPEPFHAVGLWYVEFDQTTDAEVRQLLALANQSSFGPEHKEF